MDHIHSRDRLPRHSSPDFLRLTRSDRPITTWDQEQRGDAKKLLLKERFEVRLLEYGKFLEENKNPNKDSLINIRKEDFQSKVRENREEEYILNFEQELRNIQPSKYEDEAGNTDNDKIEIDKTFGFLLQRKYEHDDQLKATRMDILKFLKQKIQNVDRNNKKQNFIEWSSKIDDYCTDQGTEGNIYNKTLIDMQFCAKENLTTTNSHLDKYSGINSEILNLVKDINRSFARDSIQRSTNPDDEARITEELRVQYTDPDLMAVRQEYEDYEMAASLARWEEQELRQAEYGTRPVSSQLSDGASRIPERLHESAAPILERLQEMPESPSSYQQHVYETQSTHLQSQEDADLERAIQLSRTDISTHGESELARAIQEPQSTHLQSQEDADLERAIQLSLELNAHRSLNQDHSTNESRGVSRVSQQTCPEDAIQQEPEQENLRQMIQSLEQRYPVIDVSNIVSPQTIDVIKAVQQQTQRVWRLIRRRST